MAVGKLQPIFFEEETYTGLFELLEGLYILRGVFLSCTRRAQCNAIPPPSSSSSVFNAKPSSLSLSVSYYFVMNNPFIRGPMRKKGQEASRYLCTPGTVSRIENARNRLEPPQCVQSYRDEIDPSATDFHVINCG